MKTIICLSRQARGRHITREHSEKNTPVLEQERCLPREGSQHQVRKRHFLSTFYAKNAHITKTGSGHT